MNQSKFIVFLFASLLGFLPKVEAQNNIILTTNPIKVLEQVIDSVYSVKAVRFEMLSKERIEGELIPSHAVGVIQFEPRKIFLRGFGEDGELLNEVLYIQGENNNNALISPNGFPFINISLDPEGATMRKNRHFTIFEAGGRYLVDMMKLGLEQYKSRANIGERFSISKIDSESFKLTITNKDFTTTRYQVLEGETIRTIARKIGVAEYQIVELNEEVSDFDDIEEGQELIVTNLYAQRVELIIRASDYIPMEVRIFDDKGLFAEYVYTYFDTNPSLNSNTFNSDNPAYTF